MSMYGTRDAALNWAMEYGETLRAAGYVQGKSSPCLFHKKAIGVSVMVHGDDFVAVGPDRHLGEVRKTLEDKYKTKVEMLGSNAGQVQEMRILNKVVRVTNEGIELEADPRHAELVVKELGLDNSKTTAVPGSKEEAKRVSASTSSVPSGAEKATTRARLNVESDLDSVQSARESVDDDRWDVDECSEVGFLGDENDAELDAQRRIYTAESRQG